MGTEYQAIVYGVGCSFDKLNGYKGALKKFASYKDPKYSLYCAFEEVTEKVGELHRVLFYEGYECPRYIGVVLRASHGVFSDRKRNVLPFPPTWRHYSCTAFHELLPALEGMITSHMKTRADAAWYGLREELGHMGLVLPPPALYLVRDYV